MSYASDISFHRNVLTTLEPRWVESCLPWQLASRVSLPMAGLSVRLPAGSESKSTQSVWLLSSFLSYAPPVGPLYPIKHEPSAHDKLGFSLCSNHKGIFRVIPFLVILFAVTSYCHLWACTDPHSSLLLLPGSRDAAMPAWSTQLGKWTSSTQPIMAGLWSTYTVQWLEPWHTREVDPLTAPKGPSFSMG